MYSISCLKNTKNLLILHQIYKQARQRHFLYAIKKNISFNSIKNYVCWPRRQICASFISESNQQNSQTINKTQNCTESLIASDVKLIDSFKTTFPIPINSLKNFFYLFGTSNKDFSYQIEFQQDGEPHAPTFVCTLRLSGPISKELEAYGKNKRMAEAAVAVKALVYLYGAKLIDHKGRPLQLVDSKKKIHVLKSKVMKLFRNEIPIHISPTFLSEIETMITQFKTEIIPTVTGPSLSEGEEEEDDIVPLDFITGKPLRDLSSSDRRNIDLLNRLNRINQRIETNPYIISNSRDQILAAIDSGPVTIIEGGTGCGKSTQVPQMILNEWIKEERGSECNIVVSQPRRIATLALAKWVASERKGKIGHSVGYKMRLDDKFLRNRGGIMFYTGGSLREMLRVNPNLVGVSHVIIDEVHERSMDTDILLLLLKSALLRYPDIKLILMSATAEIIELKSYFNTENVVSLTNTNPFLITCSHLEEVVDMVYKEEDQKIKVLSATNMWGKNPRVDCSFVADVVRFIDAKKPEGAVLVFLPGWNEIKAVQNTLASDSCLWVLPLHSRLPGHLQSEVFQQPEEGRRKVVLATNIAETSLTIHDAVYVVDSGLQNSTTFDPRKNISNFETVWISRANATQRMGRAGRVRPGEVFRLYDASLFADMDEFPQPEVLKLPLESVVVRCKSLFEKTGIRTFLNELLEAPSPLAVETAIENLTTLRILKEENTRDYNSTEHISEEHNPLVEEEVEGENEVLTPLGYAVSRISTSPVYSKALIYSSFLRCTESVLNYTAVESKTIEIFKEFLTNVEFRDLKININKRSDLLAMCDFLQQIIRQHEIQNEMMDIIFENESDDENCSSLDSSTEENKNHILQESSQMQILDSVCPNRLAKLIQLKRLFQKQLNDLSAQSQRLGQTLDFVSTTDRNRTERDNHDSTQQKELELDSESDSELILASFLSSATSIIRRVADENNSTFLVTENGLKVSIHKSSVWSSQDLQTTEDEFFFSTDIYYSQNRNTYVARELSSVPSMAVALFYGKELKSVSRNETQEDVILEIGSDVRFQMDSRTASCILGLRKLGELLIDMCVDPISVQGPLNSPHINEPEWKQDDPLIKFRHAYINLLRRILAKEN